MHAIRNSARDVSHADRRRHFTMLLAISVPIMALYVAGAIDYANMLFNDQPTEVAVELAAPAEMAAAMKTDAALLESPELAYAASYSEPDAPARTPSGETTLASAATSAAWVSY